MTLKKGGGISKKEKEREKEDKKVHSQARREAL